MVGPFYFASVEETRYARLGNEEDRQEEEVEPDGEGDEDNLEVLVSHCMLHNDIEMLFTSLKQEVVILEDFPD